MRQRVRSCAVSGLVVLCACIPVGQTPPSPGPVAQVPESVFTLAVLPDSQGYSQWCPEIFESQTAWLLANKGALNLQMVVHVGDLVEGSWISEQWEAAQSAMFVLDGEIPFIIAPGNHDYGEEVGGRNARNRTTRLHTYFPRSTFEAMPTFGGFYPDGDRTDNSYHRFDFGGSQWLVVALEFGPRDAVLEWARNVIADHPRHTAVLATHAYLYSDDTRYDWAAKGDEQKWNPHTYGIASSPEGVNDGEEIWQHVVAPNENVVAVVSGHVLNDGLGYAVTNGVHEILANYQMNDHGGEGYLRLMQFDPENREVQVLTYSPWLDRYDDSPENQFSFSH